MVRIVRKEQDSVIGGVTIDCANTVTLYADGFSITLNYNGEEGGSDLAKLIQELTDWEKAHE